MNADSSPYPDRSANPMAKPSTPPRPAILADVAKRAGVHKSTAQRALSGSGYVDEETLGLVQQAARELGYDPARQQAARALAMAKQGKFARTRTLAAFLPAGFHLGGYFTRLFQGVVDGSSAVANDLLVKTLAQDHGLTDLPHAVRRGDVDAVIAIAHSADIKALAKRLQAEPAVSGRPLVSLVNPVPGIPCVTADFRGGARLAAAHLLAQGHRRILHFHLDHGDHRQLSDRPLGYRDAARAANLDHAAIFRGVSYEGFGSRAVNAADTLDAAMGQHPGCTAILCVNDYDAVELIAALQRRGLSVPDDLSIVGYDDTHLWPGPGTDRNHLTTVAVPLEDIGREAVVLALRLVEGETAVEQVELATRFVERRSTAAPQADAAKRITKAFARR